MKHLRKKLMFAATKKNSALELLMYDQIGADWLGDGVTAKDVKQKIDEAGAIDKIVVRINSPGGDVFEGAAIYSVLTQSGKPVEVYVDGLAASAAFTIAMAGSKIFIGESAMMMLHNAWSIAIGDANEMRTKASLLEKTSGTMRELYAKRSGKPADAVQAEMDAETWLTAAEAVAGGYADEVISVDKNKATKARALTASFESRFWSLYQNTPEQFRAAPAPANDCECDCEPCENGDCARCESSPCDAEGCVCNNRMASSSTVTIAAHADMCERRLRLTQ